MQIATTRAGLTWSWSWSSWSWSNGESGRWFRSRLLERGVRTAGAVCWRCLVATPRPPPAVAEGVCLVRRRSRGFRCPQSAMFEQPRWFVGVPQATAAGLLTALPAVAAHKIAAAARASPLPLHEPSPARRSRRGPGGGYQAMFEQPRWSVWAARDGTDADPVGDREGDLLENAALPRQIRTVSHPSWMSTRPGPEVTVVQAAGQRMIWVGSASLS